MVGLQALDQSLVVALQGILAGIPFLEGIVLRLAVFGIYSIPLIWIVWWFFSGRRQREVLLSAMAAGILGWQVINRLFKALYFHPRPNDLGSAQELLFARPENSFPSDHAAFLAGIAFFFLWQKQLRPTAALLIFGLLIGLSRIAIGVHYPSDILVGYVVGFLASWVMARLHPWLVNTIWPPLLRLAQRLHLA